MKQCRVWDRLKKRFYTLCRHFYVLHLVSLFGNGGWLYPSRSKRRDLSKTKCVWKKMRMYIHGCAYRIPSHTLPLVWVKQSQLILHRNTECCILRRMSTKTTYFALQWNWTFNLALSFSDGTRPISHLSSEGVKCILYKNVKYFLQNSKQWCSVSAECGCVFVFHSEQAFHYEQRLNFYPLSVPQHPTPP